MLFCYFYYLKSISIFFSKNTSTQPSGFYQFQLYTAKNVYFNLLPVKYVILKTVIVSISCHGHLPESVAGVYFEINLNQKTLKLYTS